MDMRRVPAPASRISPPLLHAREFHQRGHGLPFIGMRLDHHLAAISDPAPFAHKAGTAEQVGLDAHAVKSPHVARSIDPAHLQVGREDFQLADSIKHVAIRARGLCHDIRGKRLLPP